MYYEATLQYIRPDEDSGRDKKITERLLVEHPDGFAEAEAAAYKYANDHIPAEADVTAIRRTRIIEFVNEPTAEPFRIYYITFLATTVDDHLKEKTISYLVALYAPNIDRAQTLAKAYQKQGLSDMTITQVAETKITNVIKPA